MERGRVMLTVMRMPVVAVTIVLLLTAALAAPAPAAAQAPAAPCTTATAACEQWVTLAGGPARSRVYASYTLVTPNANIRRALIMVHGANRNADRYFSSALAAAFLAGALPDTIVISPRLASAAGNCTDLLADNEVELELRRRQLALRRQRREPCHADFVRLHRRTAARAGE